MSWAACSSFLDILRPAEGVFFKPFGNDPIAGAIEVEDFNESAALIGEKESGSAGGVDFDGIACQFGESVKGFAHVAGLQCDVDFKVSVEGEHWLVRRRL